MKAKEGRFSVVRMTRRNGIRFMNNILNGESPAEGPSTWVSGQSVTDRMTNAFHVTLLFNCLAIYIYGLVRTYKECLDLFT